LEKVLLNKPKEQNSNITEGSVNCWVSSNGLGLLATGPVCGNMQAHWLADQAENWRDSRNPLVYSEGYCSGWPCGPQAYRDRYQVCTGLVQGRESQERIPLPDVRLFAFAARFSREGR
jgi:hypothetical protein